MNRSILLSIALSIMILTGSKGQVITCAESEPICTGPEFTYQAGTTGSAEPGAYYGCLSTQPAPAWFHMLVEDPGDITIYMYSTPLVDIDFMCWGPFTNPVTPCVEGLTETTAVDCSYSPNPTEYCDIPDAETGEYYILMITNYSQQPAQISFSQTGGTGSLDCSLINFIDVAFSAAPTQGPVPLTVSFTDQSTGEPTEWKWDFENDGTYDAFIQDPYFNYSEPGTYTVKLWVANEWETDSIVYIDYINVLAPDIQVVPPFLTILQEQSMEPSFSVSDTLATVSVNNTGNYTLSINSIQLSEEWLLISGFPPVPFTIDPGEGQEIIIDIDWDLLEGQSQTTSILILSSDPDEPVVNITVTATPLSFPELSIYEAYALPETVYAGDDIIVTSVVQNLGYYDAGENHTGYFLSSDTLYNEEDTPLGVALTRPLTPGEFAERTDTLTIPAETEAGDWHILFFTDADHQVDETDETNNIFFVELNVDTATWIKTDNGNTLSGPYKIYPNPAKDGFYIMYTGKGKGLQNLEINDSQGNTVNSIKIGTTGQKLQRINCGQWSPGLYILRMDDGRETFYGKILIEGK